MYVLKRNVGFLVVKKYLKKILTVSNRQVIYVGIAN